ncbi:MAG: PDZ domain-containing protein [Chitinophagaceae bacterium]|nr:MAG: PDZ domain-containing protein [Chitinophagaceae bacterium]
MKHTKLLLLLAFAAQGAIAQTRVWKEAAPRDHYEIIRETCFANVDVQDHDGRPTVEKLFDTGRYANEFKVGDVITGIDDITVAKAREWEAAMDRFKPEQKATVHVLRNGKAVDVPVQLRRISVFGKVD